MTVLPQTPLERIRTYLVGLKMSCALEALDACVRRLEDGELSALGFLDELLGEEHATRETRRIKSSLMTARLTRIKTLEGFDFSFQPSLDKNRILALAELAFIERREVVHLLGPPGTGKSHLAIALGVESVKAGQSVYFATLAEIIDSLAKAEREGKLAQRIGFITRSALLIIDEVGYLPVLTCFSNSSMPATSAAPSSLPPTAASASGVNSSAITWSRPRYWIVCCIMPSSSRSPAIAIDYASTPNWCRRTCACHPSQCRLDPRNDADDHRRNRRPDP